MKVGSPQEMNTARTEKLVLDAGVILVRSPLDDLRQSVRTILASSHSHSLSDRPFFCAYICGFKSRIERGCGLRRRDRVLGRDPLFVFRFFVPGERVLV